MSDSETEDDRLEWVPFLESDSPLDGQVCPFQPTSDEQIKSLLDMGEISEKDYVLDLGCGDGRILIEIVKHQTGTICRGVEISDYRVKQGKEEIEKLTEEQKGRIELCLGSFTDESFTLSPATVIVMYLLPEVMKMLFDQLKDYVKKHKARVITIHWPLNGDIKPCKVDEGKSLFVYDESCF
eukprot:CAMPEP_0201522766 /NCGR_PEP_ID=MMETSP0161_2-20130828/18538_1 /ASSEMBLY_ACC=CAM_ASM_000251 /TAXON_ID=180227 /ORGANISM="Neoparamoeba aestuarina, Strain SoJaBio B1-5/56/2" /LENGTH=181 /DNA_ID=CAMNT_0047921697 /DNA_START=58 /DNA_END=603 /DNA_ORIENTATION=+